MARKYTQEAKVIAQVERADGTLVEVVATYRIEVTPGRLSGPPEYCYPTECSDAELVGDVEVITYDTEGDRVSSVNVPYGALDKDLIEELDKELDKAEFDDAEPDYPDYDPCEDREPYYD